MLCYLKSIHDLVDGFIRKFDVGRETSNETLKNTMDLIHNYLVNTHLILMKRNSTQHLFSCFKNLYGSLKKITHDGEKYHLYL